jgi:ribonuclease HII
LPDNKIIGLDEVGRGPLAGPVVAVSSFFNCDKKKLIKQDFWKKIKDSKKYSPEKRKEVYNKILKSGFIEWGIGIVSPKKIDEVNILEATKIAMEKSLSNINYKDYLLIIDGNFKINLDCNQKSIVKADEKILECSISSIIAKVERDKIMERYHKRYPLYHFNENKGYGTKNHINSIKRHGISLIHRKSFKLKKNLI